MKTKTAIICALIAIVAVLAIVAGVVVLLHHNSDDEVDPAVALQTAREAYRVYATKYSSTTYMSEYYLYVAAENKYTAAVKRRLPPYSKIPTRWWRSIRATASCLPAPSHQKPSRTIRYPF